jgi:hypothetical protein
MLAATARAEPAVGETPFVTLDRVDGRTHGRVELAYGSAKEFGDFGVYEVTTMRLEAHGQWVERKHGLGGYATAGAIARTFEGEGRPIGFPSLELGGIYAKRIDRSVDIATHAGVAFSPRNSNDDGIASFYSGFGRITDAARNDTDTTWLRVAASPVIRAGLVVVRADVGLDFPLRVAEFSEAETLLRLGVGVGIQHGIHRAGLESVALLTAAQVTSDHPGRGGIGTVAATYRLKLQKIEIYGAVVTPIKAEEAGRSLIVGVDVLK